MKFLTNDGKFILSDGKMGIQNSVGPTPTFAGLCFTANEANSTIGLGKCGEPAWTGSYSTDGENWTTYNPSPYGTISVQCGDFNAGETKVFNVAAVPNVGDDIYIYYRETPDTQVQSDLSFQLSVGFTGQFNSANSTLTLTNTKSEEDFLNRLYYSVNKVEYLTLSKVGDKIYFKGDVTNDFDNDNYIHFAMTGSIAASGNCNSMYVSNGFDSLTTLTYAYCYFYLFSGCMGLTSAPILPATTLSAGCYGGMFSGCASLTTPPELPATTLAESCYCEMFAFSGILSSPTLPALNVPANAYNTMFAACSSLLTTQPILVTQASEMSLGYMFGMCESLTSAANITLNIENIPNYCYYGMFYQCTSLVNPPQISASSVGEMSCAVMFYSCTSLVSAPTLPATSLEASCYHGMFIGCGKIETAPILPATTLYEECYAQMFYGCTSLVNPPALPATTLAFNCYNGMFVGCTSLVSAPELPATTMFEQCYDSMFSGCTSLVTVPQLPATTLAEDCYERMFSGCTSLQVSDTQTTDAPYAWTIPVSGTFTDTSKQTYVFEDCLGERDSDHIAGKQGESYTYYTQNKPIPVPTPVMPSKGDVIYTDLGNGLNKYSVLSVSGTEVKLMLLDCLRRVPTESDLNENIKYDADDDHHAYAGSNIDNFITSTYYNSLNATTKAALINKPFVQEYYSFYSEKPANCEYVQIDCLTDDQAPVYIYSAKTQTPAEASINRSIRIPSYKDFAEAVEATHDMTESNTTFTYSNINNVMLGGTTRQGYMMIENGCGSFTTAGNSQMFDVDCLASSSRPSCVVLFLDMSNISYTTTPRWEVYVQEKYTDNEWDRRSKYIYNESNSFTLPEPQVSTGFTGWMLNWDYSTLHQPGEVITLSDSKWDRIIANYN